MVGRAGGPVAPMDDVDWEMEEYLEMRPKDVVCLSCMVGRFGAWLSMSIAFFDVHGLDAVDGDQQLVYTNDICSGRLADG